jgi:tRNA dimethylallyltransferase
MNNTLIVLLGPTGVGKTELSLELARHFASDIISCDSRQFYHQMHIGTAAPEEWQLSYVQHHFVNFLSVEEYYSASLFERDVLALLPSLFKKNPVVIMTGGSMLYIDAVCKGIDDIPDTDSIVRQKYIDLYEKEGIEGLRLALRLLDPKHYASVDLQNPRRIMRALEISETTGRPYSSFLTASSRERDFRIIKAGIGRDREKLFERINNRVDEMIASGLEEEARSLYKYKGLNALNTVGYRELFSWFDGEITREKAIELIKRNTRRYAKKQLTWWSKDKDIVWFDASEKERLKEWLSSETAYDKVR